ncbi:unnamed protein product [Brassica oleracea var. botrytis]|uniref:(rape) hypothetical protein n=2 Tax=Brassica TaxID=3705 RepID=A0A078HV41_BRANA|nr:unnamed protein product [Brassica napus]CDY41576.1 BnaC05g43130D [Brassica napus]
MKLNEIKKKERSDYLPKGRSLSKRVEDCGEFEEEGNGATTVPSDVKEGHVAVIAVKGERVVRFVFELQELYKPEFRKLLEHAGEEFGFQPRGPLTILCQPEEEEHKLFLIRVLIPLHKPKPIEIYHQQLSYCIVQFVEKDYKLADTVIRGLLKYLPVTNCTKENLFLQELEEVLEATQPVEFQRCMVPLFQQIARCLNSSHFQHIEAMKIEILFANVFCAYHLQVNFVFEKKARIFIVTITERWIIRTL